MEISLRVKAPQDDNADIVIAFLSEYPFASFTVEDGIVKAYSDQAISSEVLSEIEEKVKDFLLTANAS